jgi:DNA-binding NtrC family response regulator
VTPEVLIVDDDDALRWICGRALLADGLPVDVMRTAREAIQAMELSPARLVLMDVRLADDDEFENGCDAAFAIVGRWPNTRILLITGLDFSTLSDGCRELPVLTKPFTAPELVNRVRYMLEHPPWKPSQ